jgi:hypothetical protein
LKYLNILPSNTKAHRLFNCANSINLLNDNDKFEDLQSININANINIDYLQGNKKDIEDWFDNWERLAYANGWDNKILALKLPSFLKEKALLVWKAISQEMKLNYIQSTLFLID